MARRPLVCVLASALLAFSGCSYMPQRMGYDRNTGTWPDPVYRTPEERAASPAGISRGGDSAPAAVSRDGKSAPAPAANRSLTADEQSLRKVIKPWMGTPYVYGGSTRQGTDCSGFVLNVMRDWAGISLPRTAEQQAKLGRPVSSGSLQAGDAVFFGSWNRVEHVGIALGDGTFAHASTSKGVTVTPLSAPYWAKRYKGARRF